MSSSKVNIVGNPILVDNFVAKIGIIYKVYESRGNSIDTVYIIPII